MTRIITTSILGVLSWIFIYCAYTQYRQPSVQLGVVVEHKQQDSMIIINRKNISSFADSSLMNVIQVTNPCYGCLPKKNRPINTAYGYRASYGKAKDD